MGVILKRKKDESIILKTKEGDIEILVMHGTNTKLNITAPQSVKIWRKELLDENNQLLPRDRTVESSEQNQQNVHIYGYQPPHTQVASTSIETSKIRGGVAEIEKMSKCRDARLKAEDGHFYMTLWCHSKDVACECVCDDWKNKAS